MVSALSFPLSAILAATFIIAVLAGRRKLKGSSLLKFLAGRQFSAFLLVLTAVLVAVEGTWSPGIFHHPGFLFIIFLMMFSLSLCFSVSHLGFLLVLFGGFFGAPDFTAANMAASREGPVSFAVTADGYTVPLDFSVTLEDFHIDYYPDSLSPRQYTSVLDIDGERKTTSVNHPCLHNGYLIYQSDYDKEGGNYSILHIVRDPWLPLILLGMLVLAFGAVMDLRKVWQSKAVLVVVIILSVVFALISLSRIKFGTLMPALRSLWFVPHLIVYMVAYSVLALSVVFGVISLFKRPEAGELSAKLLRTASSLLLIGMLCGAAWAKMAWGDYWTWDAKECWAATTWLLTLVGIHLPRPARKKGMLAFIVLAFLAMQVTWYGVNYLPSAGESLHTYNTK